MGRVVTPVTISNVKDPSKSITFDARIDPGASHVTLPMAWRDRLGQMESVQTVRVEMASQNLVEGVLCGPVKVQIEGFRPTFGEVVFMAMTPEEGKYEPLLGYLVLEQSGIAVDVVGHRLIPLRHFDLK